MVAQMNEKEKKWRIEKLGSGLIQHLLDDRSEHSCAAYKIAKEILGKDSKAFVSLVLDFGFKDAPKTEEEFERAWRRIKEWEAMEKQKKMPN